MGWRESWEWQPMHFPVSDISYEKPKKKPKKRKGKKMIYKMKGGYDIDLNQIESVTPITNTDEKEEIFWVHYKSGRQDDFTGKKEDLENVRKKLVDAWRNVAHDYEKR
jgi:hypothetical protein